MIATQPFSLLTVCSACGTSNRIPASHLADRGRCGACKAPLPPVAHPIDAGADTFDEILRSAKTPVLVDFWAPWCGPCRMAAPEIHKLAQQMAGRIVVVKVDTEAHPSLAARYRIQSIPHFVIFRNGQPISARSGVLSSS